MIIINDKNYDNISKKVSFDEYSVTQDGKKEMESHLLFLLSLII